MSWDGVVENTPATNPGDRFVWDLAAKKSRNLMFWSEQTQLYDEDCGWTPDNRIWHFRSLSQPLGDGNAPYTPTIYLESPDGKHKVVCHDSDRKFWYDEQSYFDEKSDMRFSRDGSKLFLLTNSFYRIFNTRNGKMLVRRKLSYRERERYSDGSDISTFLSTDGSRILMVQGEKSDHKIGKFLSSGQWFWLDARTGRLIKHLKSPSKAQIRGISEANLLIYQKDETIFHARSTDLKTIWSEPVTKPDESLEATVLSSLFVIRDARNGNRRVFEIKVDSRKQLKDAVISPDRKIFYALDIDDQILRFSTVEIKAGNKKLLSVTQR